MPMLYKELASEVTLPDSDGAARPPQSGVERVYESLRHIRLPGWARQSQSPNRTVRLPAFTSGYVPGAAAGAVGDADILTGRLTGRASKTRAPRTT